MSSGKQNGALKASWFLVVATLCWAFSYPAMKALGLVQQKLLPDESSWFFASLSLVIRFGISAFILLLWSWRTLGKITKLELQQGIGLGLVGGVGLLFQMDAVSYTSASTVAFLTQCYCIFIPVFVAFRRRRWPAKALLLSCVLVISGVAILSDIDWREMRLGRGEWEAIVASMFFTAQILWLERPKFSPNNASHVTVIMFVVNLISILPVFFLVKPSWQEVGIACSSTIVLLLYAVLTVLSTLAAYTLMNRWQPHIEATRAGLIYCSEPVFASLFALFIPYWLSRIAGINYPNETLTANLLVGGGLITAANVFIMLQATRRND